MPTPDLQDSAASHLRNALAPLALLTEQLESRGWDPALSDLAELLDAILAAQYRLEQAYGIVATTRKVVRHGVAVPVGAAIRLAALTAMDNARSQLLSAVKLLCSYLDNGYGGARHFRESWEWANRQLARALFELDRTPLGNATALAPDPRAPWPTSPAAAPARGTSFPPEETLARAAALLALVANAVDLNRDRLPADQSWPAVGSLELAGGLSDALLAMRRSL